MPTTWTPHRKKHKEKQLSPIAGVAAWVKSDVHFQSERLMGGKRGGYSTGRWLFEIPEQTLLSHSTKVTGGLLLIHLGNLPHAYVVHKYYFSVCISDLPPQKWAAGNAYMNLKPSALAITNFKLHPRSVEHSPCFSLSLRRNAATCCCTLWMKFKRRNINHIIICCLRW